MTRSFIGKGLILLGTAMILTMIVIGMIGEVTQDGQKAATRPSPTDSTPNPQQSELLRCQGIGEAAAQDAACLALWAETRRRFLTPALPMGEGN